MYDCFCLFARFFLTKRAHYLHSVLFLSPNVLDLIFIHSNVFYLFDLLTLCVLIRRNIRMILSKAIRDRKRPNVFLVCGWQKKKAKKTKWEVSKRNLNLFSSVELSSVPGSVTAKWSASSHRIASHQLNKSTQSTQSAQWMLNRIITINHLSTRTFSFISLFLVNGFLFINFI